VPIRITREIIEGAAAGARISDDVVEGLTLKVSKSGKKSWTLRYRHAGERREYRLGAGAALTASQARDHARKRLNELAGGTDPLAAKVQAKADAAALKARKTVRQFAETYKSTVAKKPLTKDSDESILDKWILPLLGSVAIAEIGKEHAQQLHAFVTDAGFKTRANRSYALLSHMVTEAARRGLREAPFPRGVITRHEEKPRERYLSPAETAKLWKALTAMQRPTKKGRPGVHSDAAAALKVLLLTGCRKREVLNLSWAEVDADSASLRLADSKTGSRVVQLSPAALALLEARRPAEDDADASLFVFPRDDGKAPIADCKRAWEAAIKAAELPELRVHDLRHSHAAAGIAAGLSLPEIGRLLGHKSQQTTARYAHVADSVARAAANKVGARMAKIIRSADGLRAVK
jgi:integrase